MRRGLRTDVDSIVVIRPTDSGRARTREIYHVDVDDDDRDEVRVRLITRDRHGRRIDSDWDDDDDGRRRKSSRQLRPLEKFLRNSARRQSNVADVYLRLHNKSNRRKKNGWVKDLGGNMIKAYRRGLRLGF